MEKTVLIVDVESGSVGCALARIIPGEAPKLFAESRVALPIFNTLSSATLVGEIEKTAREMITHASLVAARLRGHESVAQMGIVSSALVFCSPPWTSLTTNNQGLGWEHEPAVASAIRDAIKDVFGDVPVSFHAFGTAAMHASNTLFQNQNEFLLCTVGGELAELLLVDGGHLAGHATLPIGQHTVLRTLQHHAGISAQEARSALRLRGHNAFAEPLEATATHLEKEFGGAVDEMLGEHFVHGILVIAPEPLGEWFARALSQAQSLAEIFPHGTAVQALHTRHLAPYLAAHAALPDLLLMLEALFANKKFNTVY